MSNEKINCVKTKLSIEFYKDQNQEWIDRFLKSHAENIAKAYPDGIGWMPYRYLTFTDDDFGKGLLSFFVQEPVPTHIYITAPADSIHEAIAMVHGFNSWITLDLASTFIGYRNENFTNDLLTARITVAGFQ